MDETQKFTCAICLDIFKTPRILACFHTFCEICLEKYIQQKMRNNTISCPICRSDISVPAIGVKGFSVNFYIPENVCRKEKDYCPKHSTEEITVYCTVCHSYGCLKCECTLFHRTQNISDYRKEYKASLLKLQNDLQQYYRPNDDNRKRHMNSLVQSAKKAKLDIDEQVKSVVKKSQDMKDEIDSIVNIENDKYNYTIQATSPKITELDAYSAMISNALKTDALINISHIRNFLLDKQVHKKFEISAHQKLSFMSEVCSLGKLCINQSRVFKIPIRLGDEIEFEMFDAMGNDKEMSCSIEVIKETVEENGNEYISIRTLLDGDNAVLNSFNGSITITILNSSYRSLSKSVKQDVIDFKTQCYFPQIMKWWELDSLCFANDADVITVKVKVTNAQKIRSG